MWYYDHVCTHVLEASPSDRKVVQRCRSSSVNKFVKLSLTEKYELREAHVDFGKTLKSMHSTSIRICS
jgi:hypothetical protein